MIFLCQTCGYRINQRTADGSTWRPDEPLKRTGVRDKDVGKHLLYNHKPFCSKECIGVAKKNPYILQREVVPSNELERPSYNPNRPNNLNNWKTERKIGRIRNNGLKRNKI